MKFVASQDKSLQKVGHDATVTAFVGIGTQSDMGFGLKVDLEVSLPGISTEDAMKIIVAGHKICPYSHATQGNIDVNTTLAGRQTAAA